MRKGKSIAKIAVLTTLILLLANTQPVAADSAGFVSRINQLRESQGVSRLNVSGSLASAAGQWARHMAGAGKLSHSSTVSSSGGKPTAENVGKGSSVDEIMGIFNGSARHRQNMLNAKFGVIGVGAATGADNLLYVCVLFSSSSDANAVQSQQTSSQKSSAAASTSSRSATHSAAKTTATSTTTTTVPTSEAQPSPQAQAAPVSGLILVGLFEISSIESFG